MTSRARFTRPKLQAWFSGWLPPRLSSCLPAGFRGRLAAYFSGRLGIIHRRRRGPVLHEDGRHSRAVQVDPIKPELKPRLCFQREQPKCGEPL